MKISNATLGIVAAAAGLWALLRKNKGAAGIGSMYIPRATIDSAIRLFRAYDESCKIAREIDEQSNAIFDDLESRGVDISTEEGERIAAEALYQAGLADENGETDAYVNCSNARKRLLDFIYTKILPKFPLTQSDIALFKNNYNVVLQDKLLNATREFLEKQTGIKGIGKVEHSDYDGARVISKDGRHAISFDIYGRGENGITVTSEMKGYGERYGFDWEFLSHIGDYKTLSGAIKAAKRYWNMSGIQYNEKDFERI